MQQSLASQRLSDGVLQAHPSTPQHAPLVLLVLLQSLLLLEQLILLISVTLASSTSSNPNSLSSLARLPHFGWPLPFPLPLLLLLYPFPFPLPLLPARVRSELFARISSSLRRSQSVQVTALNFPLVFFLLRIRSWRSSPSSRRLLDPLLLLVPLPLPLPLLLDPLLLDPLPFPLPLVLLSDSLLLDSSVSESSLSESLQDGASSSSIRFSDSTLRLLPSHSSSSSKKARKAPSRSSLT
mmetsp:Transcript_28281/g.57811  ORF Transcript_28281/g.57811 Transcript_28281/m.57811 type:complete len:239 (-) Transcript_28281:471-1187(-)